MTHSICCLIVMHFLDCWYSVKYSEARYNDLLSCFFSDQLHFSAFCCCILTHLQMFSAMSEKNSLTFAKLRWQIRCEPLCRLLCWKKSWVWWSAVSPRTRHVERISCSKACLSPDQQQRCSGWVYVYCFDHGKLVTWALHSSRGSCQSFGSIFVWLVPGGGVVSSSLECLLWLMWICLSYIRWPL